MASTGRVPEAGVEYVRGLRNVKYYETMFELLAKQYELAKIDEARDSSVIQVLHKAVWLESHSHFARDVRKHLALAVTAENCKKTTIEL